MKNMFKVQMLLLLFAGIFCFGENVSLLRNGTFNHEEGALSFWSVRTGNLGTAAVLPGEVPGDSGIFQAKVTSASHQPWSMELLQRFDTDVPKSSVVHISFEYKITAGYSFNFYWQEEREPWPKLMSLHADSPVDTWHRAEMAVPVHEELKAQATSFSFHLAEKTGIFELRNVSAVIYPPGTNPDSLSTNTEPVLGGDFYDKDWRNLATIRLEKVRMVPVQLKVLTAGGTPATGAEITVRQRTRPFAFGFETSFPLFKPALLEDEHWQDVAKKFKPYKEQLEAHSRKLLTSGMFDFVTFTDGLTWREFETRGRSKDLELVKEVLEAGLNVRGHALFIPAYMFAPVPCRNMDRETLRTALLKHTETLAQRHKGSIAQWNVLHGGTDYSEIYDFTGLDSILKVFKAAESSGAQLFLSDLQALGALSEEPLNDALELAEWLMQSGVKLDGLVLGANLKRFDAGPQSMEKRINLAHSKLKIPLHIANFAVNSESDDFQSTVVSDYMLLFFSHPGIASVSFGEGWAAALLNPRMAYFREDFSPRPSAKLVKSLIMEKWNTNFTAETDKDGTHTAKYFTGIHDITVKLSSGIARITLDLQNADTGEEVFTNRKPVQIKGATARWTDSALEITLELP